MSGRLRRLYRSRVLRTVVVVAAAVAVAFGVITLLEDDPEPEPLVGEYADDFSSGTELGPRWEETGAAFVVGDGVARAEAVADTGGAAVLDAGRSSVVFTVDFDAVASGSGVVVLYQDLQNYLKVVAVEDLATWNVYRVESGQATYLGSTGGFTFHDGPVRLETITVGGVIEISVDGIQLVTLPVTESLNASRFGLFVDPADDGATEWSAASVSFAVPGATS